MIRYTVMMLALFTATSVFAQEQEVQAEAAPVADEAPIQMEDTPEGFYDVAVLQGLNKVTARISQLEAPVGTSVRFGNLEVIVQRCAKSAPNERPENAALLEIFDRKPDEAAVVAYHGWMFSSSPSLSGLEHPVYDITVLECSRRKLGEEG